MPHYRHLIAILMVTLIALTSASPGGAQTGAFPLAPDPALCVAAPRTRANFEALVARGQTTPALAVARVPALAVGQPADETTIAAVTQTAIQLYACYAAGDLLRASALWTDDHLARTYALVPYPVAVAEAPVPEAVADRPILLALRDVTALPDGRVRFSLELAYADGSTDTQYGIVTSIADGYRLDETWDVGTALNTVSPGATPTAFADPDAAAVAAVLEQYRAAGNDCDAETRASLFTIPTTTRTRAAGTEAYDEDVTTTREALVEGYRCDDSIVDQERTYDQVEIHPQGDRATARYRYQVLTHEVAGCTHDGGTTELDFQRQPDGRWLIAGQTSEYQPTTSVICP